MGLEGFNQTEQPKQETEQLDYGVMFDSLKAFILERADKEGASFDDLTLDEIEATIANYTDLQEQIATITHMMQERAQNGEDLTEQYAGFQYIIGNRNV